MRLQVCISTLGDGLLGLLDRLPLTADVGYLVGVQALEKTAAAWQPWQRYCANRPDIQTLSLPCRGLSCSRNALLEAAEAPLLLIADDDIDYLPGFEQRIFQAYEHRPEAAMISFQFDQPAQAKSYPRMPFRHTPLTLAKVSSIEITLRRAVVIEHAIRFDEAFGLGTAQPSGEELIFLRDLQRVNAALYFEPASIVEHQGVSSGRDFFSHPRLIRTKGQMLRRAYGRWRGGVMALLFGLKKYPEYRHQCGLFRFFFHLFSSP